MQKNFFFGHFILRWNLKKVKYDNRVIIGLKKRKKKTLIYERFITSERLFWTL